VRYAAVSGAVSRRSALVSVASSLRSMHVTNCRYTSPRLRCWIRSASPDAARSPASASRESGGIGAAGVRALRGGGGCGRGGPGDGGGARRRGEPLAVASQAGDAVLEQGTTRDIVRDEGVAVSVAADPGAELEERGQLPVLRRVSLPQRALQLVHQLGHDVEQVLVDEVHPPRLLLLDSGFLEP